MLRRTFLDQNNCGIMALKMNIPQNCMAYSPVIRFFKEGVHFHIRNQNTML